MKAGRNRGIGLLVVAIAAVLQTSPTQADSDESLIRLGAGVGALRVAPQVKSPVLHASISDDTLPTITFWFFPGTALTRHFSYARFLRISTELGVTRNTVSVAGSRVGNVRALPLNLNFEIHPFPGKRFDPFVGPGLNRTYFTVQDGGLQSFRDFQPSSGALINSGLDYWIAGGFFVEARIRKMFIKTAVISKASDNRVESIKVNPWTFGLSTGYRF